MSKSKSTKLIPAVAYLRKSTKGERADGTKKQEKSLAQQRTEIAKLVDCRFEIPKDGWFEDEGISGWKRGAKRPDFQRMLEQVQDLGAEAIVCDNIDRFSRATYDDVQEDAAALRKAGVRWIVTASHGEYDLQAGRRNDIGGIITFAAAVWAAHEYSRQLSRRITLARRNAAIEGKRTGSRPPYGYDQEGKNGLKLGDAGQRKIVRWIFDQFANKGESVPWITEQLNEVKKSPSPNGKMWRPQTIKIILRNRVYCGDFVYNQRPNGQFFTIDSKGELAERADMNGEQGKPYVVRDRFPAIIDRPTFDKAQRRLQRTKQGKSMRVRKYALSGVLVCGHCGEKLHGVTMYKRTVYRCGFCQRRGQASDRGGLIREAVILPFILKLLSEEVSNLAHLTIISPPDELVEPRKRQAQNTERLQQDIDKLQAKIKKARQLLYTTDKRNLAAIEADIKEMLDELDRLNEKRDSSPNGEGYKWVKLPSGEKVRLFNYSKQEEAALADWWKKFNEQAVVMADGEDGADLVSPLAINEALHEVGTLITLRWKTIDTGVKRSYTSRNKNKAQRKKVLKPLVHHVVEAGRFQLGHKKGNLPRYVCASSAGRASRHRTGAFRRVGLASIRTPRGRR